MESSRAIPSIIYNLIGFEDMLCNEHQARILILMYYIKPF